MSTENVKKFYEAVSQDESLKQKFVELSQKYQGQQMDEAKMKSITEEEVLPMAKQIGYSFTMDDLKEFGEEMKRANMNCELSEEEMEAVTGGREVINPVVWCINNGLSNWSGITYCFIIGIAIG
jgi:predicted ribosomally synthesized peptide with nif11-like leader